MSFQSYCAALLVSLLATWGPNGGLFAQESELEAKLRVLNPILKTVDSTAIPVEVEGIIAELNVREGDPISKDQVLGSLKETQVNAMLLQLRAKVAMAHKKSNNDLRVQLAMNNHAVASNEYERALRANDRVSNTYPRNEIDRLRLVADQTKLEIQQAEHDMELALLELEVVEAELKQAQDLLDRHFLRSPVDGIVVSVAKRKGEWADLGEEVLRIVQLSRLRVEGFLPAEVANFQLQGASAKLTVLNDKRQFTGEVVFISPELNPVDGSVRIFVDVDNSELLLRPGLKLEVLVQPKHEPANSHEQPAENRG